MGKCFDSSDIKDILDVLIAKVEKLTNKTEVLDNANISLY